MRERTGNTEHLDYHLVERCMVTDWWHGVVHKMAAYLQSRYRKGVNVCGVEEKNMYM